MTRGNEAQRDQRREEQNQTNAPSSSRPSSNIDNNTNTMDRNVRARVDQILNSLIENVNEDARAGIASNIA